MAPSPDLAKRRFRPTLWPTLITVPAVLVMLALGTWQVQRLNWKTEIIDRFEAQAAAAPIAAPQTIDDIEEMRFARVHAQGHFLHDKELLLTGRSFKGSTGFHLVTPLQRMDGGVLLVNRGWVPSKYKSAKRRPQTLVEGLVTVEGIVHQDRSKGYFVPENEPGREIWLTVHTQEIAKVRGLENVANYYVDELERTEGSRLPIGAKLVVSVRNEHLSYIVIWFSLALALSVIYVIYHYQPENDDPE
jgi:surfeit locus 1 family protein